MSATRGKFFKWWQVYCAACGKASPLLGQSKLLSDAEKARALKEGWQKRGALWFCGSCANREVHK